MVVVQEPRSESPPAYYPDCVAISNTTSAVTSVVADNEPVGYWETVTGSGRWELALQGYFLAPPEPAVEPEPEEREWRSSNEGVQLELPCPVIAVHGECEEGHHWAKVCICNREWCRDTEGRCGGDGGAAHQRRKARWLPKAYKIGGMGGFVLTLPEEVRDQYRTPESLGGLGTSAKRMMQRHGYKRGLRRWHLFGEDHPGHGLQGDGLPNYHPHLEMIVDGGWLTNKKRRAIKRSWANILGVSVERINLYYRYVQPHETKKKLHRISYALRPTFADWRWDEPLAYALIGFHNAQTWGSRADWSGPDLWEIDPKEDSAAAAVPLDGGLCPLHGKYGAVPIHWGCRIDHEHLKRCRGLIQIRTLTEPNWEHVGAGYWRWTGVGDISRIRDIYRVATRRRSCGCCRSGHQCLASNSSDSSARFMGDVVTSAAHGRGKNVPETP